MTGSFASGPATIRPHHHPDEATLMDFAAGTLREAAAVLIATHLALCPNCRGMMAGLESLGGALLDTLPPSELAARSREATLARLDEPESDAPAAAAPPARTARAPGAPILPRPLRDYAGGDLAGLPWRRLSATVDQIDLPLRGAARDHLRLLRARAGSTLPRHTHGGTEMILVLSGGFRDRGQQFLRGDVAQSDQEVDHSPVIDTDSDCICLSVTDAPLRFTGFLGRIINLFVRF